MILGPCYCWRLVNRLPESVLFLFFFYYWACLSLLCDFESFFADHALLLIKANIAVVRASATLLNVSVKESPNSARTITFFLHWERILTLYTFSCPWVALKTELGTWIATVASYVITWCGTRHTFCRPKDTPCCAYITGRAVLTDKAIFKAPVASIIFFVESLYGRTGAVPSHQVKLKIIFAKLTLAAWVFTCFTIWVGTREAYFLSLIEKVTLFAFTSL